MTQQRRKDAQSEHMAKERLLAAALDLFTERGYAATSVREIVEAAGATKPTLYYYFKNKEAIYRELITSPLDSLETLLADVLNDATTSRERIALLCDRIFSLFRERIKVARLMYAMYYGPSQGAPFIDFEGYHLMIRRSIGALVREGIQKGELAIDDPDAFGLLLTAALNFALEEQLCHGTTTIDRDGLARMLEAAFAGRTKKPRKRGA